MASSGEEARRVAPEVGGRSWQFRRFDSRRLLMGLRHWLRAWIATVVAKESSSSSDVCSHCTSVIIALKTTLGTLLIKEKHPACVVSVALLV